MSALGSLVGDIGAATGSKGSYSLNDLTKNQGVQSGLDSLIAQFKGNQANDSTDLASYIQNYLAQTPQVGKWTNQETGTLDQFYNGGMASNLANLNAQQSTAGRQAVANAIAAQRGNINRSLIGGGATGDASYLSRIGTQEAANTDLQQQLQNIGQARNDLGYITGNQTNLAGRRAALLNALSARQLMPAQASNELLGAQIGQLGGLSNVANSNNIYGVQYNPSSWEQIGNIVGDLGNTVSEGASAFGSVMGGMGGLGGGGAGASGTPSPNYPSNAQWQAMVAGQGPMNYGAANSWSQGGGLSDILNNSLY